MTPRPGQEKDPLVHPVHPLPPVPSGIMVVPQEPSPLRRPASHTRNLSSLLGDRVPPPHSNASPPSFKGGESSPFFPPHASRCRRISVSPATAGGSATSDTLPAATISSPSPDGKCRTSSSLPFPLRRWPHGLFPMESRVFHTLHSPLEHGFPLEAFYRRGHRFSIAWTATSALPQRPPLHRDSWMFCQGKTSSTEPSLPSGQALLHAPVASLHSRVSSGSHISSPRYRSHRLEYQRPPGPRRRSTLLNRHSTSLRRRHLIPIPLERARVQGDVLSASHPHVRKPTALP